jgi:branched-chain amino acid transport system ATP-binding protein
MGADVSEPEGAEAEEQRAVSDILRVEDAHKSFGGLRVLAGVSVRIPQGTTLAIIGPNGSGKSTLLNTISGFERLQSGSIWFSGTRIDSKRPDQRAALGIGRTFQQPRVYTGMTVLENLLVGAHIYGRTGLFTTFTRPWRSRSETRGAIASARIKLDLLGVPRSREQARVESLPLRDQRAVELGRILMMDPQLLLLDEPTTGMDPDQRPAWIRHMLTLQQELGISLAIVEHSMQVVAEIASSVTVLSSGAVLAHGTPEAVLADPAVRSTYLGVGVTDG